VRRCEVGGIWAFTRIVFTKRPKNISILIPMQHSTAFGCCLITRLAGKCLRNAEMHSIHLRLGFETHFDSIDSKLTFYEFLIEDVSPSLELALWESRTTKRFVQDDDVILNIFSYL
jgi:hypothetical protein